jgi:hypothetical protein
MSATQLRDPFEVADVDLELSLARLEEDPGAPSLETWVGRALLVVAIALVLVVDLRLANASPTYQAQQEAWNVAYLEQIAQHGTPPVMGKDAFEIDPTGPLPPRTVAIRGLERPVHGAAPFVVANVSMPQLLAFERPGGYYLVAPIAWIVPWHARVLVLRLLSILLICVSLAFLWVAIREAWPRNPLAAGVATMVFASMGGLISTYALFQPQVLMLPLWCAGLWLAVRDGRRRTCSWSTVLVWTAATCISSLPLPAAIAVVLYLAVRAEGRVSLRGRLPAYLATVLAPTLVWVLWNLHAYGNLWPLNVAADGTIRHRDWEVLRAVLDQVGAVNRAIFDSLYIAGLPPVTRAALVTAPFVALVLACALVWALLSGRIAAARLPLARAGALLLVSFASAYLTLFIESVAAGQQVAYTAYYFGGYAAAWAGAVGVGVTAPLVGHRRLGLAAVGGIALVLAVQMLNTPVA